MLTIRFLPSNTSSMIELPRALVKLVSTTSGLLEQQIFSPMQLNTSQYTWDDMSKEDDYCESID